MISLQRSMHSSQMSTPGPAISFLTCFWLLPQNEHFSRSPVSPTRGATGDPSLQIRAVVWELSIGADVRPVMERSAAEGLGLELLYPGTLPAIGGEVPRK